MSTAQLLANSTLHNGRPAWAREGDVVSVRVDGGNLNAAAVALEHVAKSRGLKIAEVGRSTMEGTEAAFARLES